MFLMSEVPLQLWVLFIPGLREGGVHCGHVGIHPGLSTKAGSQLSQSRCRTVSKVASGIALPRPDSGLVLQVQVLSWSLFDRKRIGTDLACPGTCVARLSKRNSSRYESSLVSSSGTHADRFSQPWSAVERIWHI